MQAQPRHLSVTGVLVSRRSPRQQRSGRVPRFDELFQMPPHERLRGEAIFDAFLAARKVYTARRERYAELYERRHDLRFEDVARLIVLDIEQRILDAQSCRRWGILPSQRFVFFDDRKYRPSRDIERAMDGVSQLRRYRRYY